MLHIVPLVNFKHKKWNYVSIYFHDRFQFLALIIYTFLFVELTARGDSWYRMESTNFLRVSSYSPI